MMVLGKNAMAYGVVTELDKLSRVYIAKGEREELGWQSNIKLEILYSENLIIVRRYGIKDAPQIDATPVAVRNTDIQYRLVLPREVRDAVELDFTDKYLEVFVEKERDLLIYRVVRKNGCTFCDTADDPDLMLMFGNRRVCKLCVAQIADLHAKL